ncbi:Gluconate transport-inducing protein [Paraconiothyrium brasiliense]|uniref:Gluconate transport-inducing protein n=1 Tax=Paraconiothyrium brasiliense TaxID=300254 RepID=A0ABR3QYR6_9PLEO
METYHGHVRTPNDAILLFEACRIGLLPRVQRRLSEKERQQIKSGSVFVWDEREAGMRRWTDGKSWSASRVSGSFLTYREMEGKRGGSNLNQPAPKRASGKSPDGSATGDSEGEGPDGYRYKPDGLMKQSFSITTSSGQHLHLISYYSRSNSMPLTQPSTDSSLRHIRPPKNMYPESTVNETQPVAAVTRGPLPGSPYTQSPHQMPTSPYSRPGPPQQPVYVPVYHPPTPPSGTPPYQHAYYGQPHYPYFQYAPVIYAPSGYPPQPGHVFDRPPPQIGHPGIPHPPPGHVAMAPHPGHPPQYIQQPPPPHALQRPELVQRHSQPNGHIPPAPPAAPIPEQGPQLPAINSTTPTSAHKPPTPQPSESQSQGSLMPPESNGAANEPSPARTIPKIGSILNNHEQSGENQSNSRSGSRSPSGSQPAIRELPPDRLASMSTATDSRALDKLNRNMFVRT